MLIIRCSPNLILRHSYPFTEVEARRPRLRRLVLEWVTTIKDWALWTGFRSSMWTWIKIDITIDRLYRLYRDDTYVKWIKTKLAKRTTLLRETIIYVSFTSYFVFCCLIVLSIHQYHSSWGVTTIQQYDLLRGILQIRRTLNIVLNS